MVLYAGKQTGAAPHTHARPTEGDPPMRAWLYLLTAIALEVSGTLSLKHLHDQPLTRALLTYAQLTGAFYLLSRAFRRIPVAVAFATWEALGLLSLTVLGAILLGEHLPRTHLLALGGLLLGSALLGHGTHHPATRQPATDTPPPADDPARPAPTGGQPA